MLQGNSISILLIFARAKPDVYQLVAMMEDWDLRNFGIVSGVRTYYPSTRRRHRVIESCGAFA